MNDIWNNVKTAIKEQIPGHTFRMWIDPIEFLNYEDDAFVIGCPNHFSRKRVLDNYATMLENEFRNASGKECKLQIEITDKNSGTGKKKTRPAKDGRVNS